MIIAPNAVVCGSIKGSWIKSLNVLLAMPGLIHLQTNNRCLRSKAIRADRVIMVVVITTTTTAAIMVGMASMDGVVFSESYLTFKQL